MRLKATLLIAALFAVVAIAQFQVAPPPGELVRVPRSFAWGAVDPSNPCAQIGAEYVNAISNVLWVCPSAGGNWFSTAGAGGSVPVGTITMISTGTCAAGFAEATELSGLTLIGTLAANGDVGTGGGANNITPAGTVAAPTLAMNSYTPAGSVAAPTFTGTASQSTSADSAGTPAGSVSTPTFTGTPGTVPAETISYPVNVPTFAGNAGTVPAETFTGSSATTSAVSAGTPAGTNGTATLSVTGTKMTTSSSGTASLTLIAGVTLSTGAQNVTVPAETFTGSALGTHTHTLTANGTNSTVSFTPAGTVAWPVNPPTNSTAAFTPAGSISTPTFTGSALGTHSHTITASGTNSAPPFTGTPATLTGTNSAPAFSGTSFDNRSAFLKVIFCKKT